MRYINTLLDVYVALQALFALSSCFSESDSGPVVASQSNGDRFKIEGRAIVSGIKTQDWISTARVLVEGEEYVGFLKWVAFITTLVRCRLEH